MAKKQANITLAIQASEPQVHHTQDEKIRKGTAICELYGQGGRTLESCCASHSISARTFYNWRKEVAEVSTAFKEAQGTIDALYKGEVKAAAQKSFLKLVEGYTYDEVRTEEGEGPQGPFSRTTVTKKHVVPNVAAVIFAMTNTDPENFQQKPEPGSTANTDTVARKLIIQAVGTNNNKQ